MINIFDLLINKKLINCNVNGYENSKIKSGCILFKKEEGLKVLLIIESKDKRDLICEYVLNRAAIKGICKDDLVEMLNYMNSIENSSYGDIDVENIENILKRNKKKIAIINKEISIFVENKTEKKRTSKVKNCIININKVKLNIDEFKYCTDGKAQECLIKLDIDEDLKEKLIFLGDEFVLSILDEEVVSTSLICKNYEKCDGKLKLVCSDPLIYELSKVKTDYLYAEESRGVENQNILHFMLRQAGLKDENISCGVTRDKETLAYKVILLIKKLQIDDEIGCSYVTFYSNETDNYEINKFKKKLESVNYSDDVFSFAEVIVNASSLYDAYILAKEIVLITSQVIRFTIRDNILNNGNINFWDKKAENWELEISKWSYIECLPYNQVIIGNINNISVQNEIYLSKDSKYIDNHLFIDNLLHKNINEDFKNVLRVVKWINKSWDSSDFEDKIIYTVIAMEFLIVNEKDNPLIEKRYIRKIGKYIREEFKEDISSETIDKVNDKIFNSLTSDTMMNKFNNLLISLDINLNEEDQTIIKDIRRIRNDITHGREYKNIDIKNIDKVNSLIIFIAKKFLEVRC